MPETKCNQNMETSGVEVGFGMKLKEEIILPKTPKRRVSLSDIIAATIGEEARSSDLLLSEESVFYSQNFTESSENNGNSYSTTTNNGSDRGQHSLSMYTETSSNACDIPQNAFPKRQNISNSVSELADIYGPPNSQRAAPALGFEADTSFWSSLFGDDNQTTDCKTSIQMSSSNASHDALTNSMTHVSNNGGQENKQKSDDASYDSDLEDSMHFVDPDENTCPKEPEFIQELVEPVSKKPRVRLHDSSSCPFPIVNENEAGIYDEGNLDFLDFFNGCSQPPTDQMSKSVFKMHGVSRARSFSGNIKPKLSRQSGKGNLRNNSSKMSSFGRTRSFSEACNRDSCDQSYDKSLNSSLSSLFESQENSGHSDNPFFKDLKSLLINDCNASDCPKTLFETLSSKQNQDVYARERNLQAKFSSLQSKYPDEVRELSSFYRQQSAEIETERLKEIHDDSIPVSYRNHLNSFYDNQLHMIMERVEKSLSLLAIAKREFVTINRPFKSRPLLSRKAVKMMEEWYSRNYEHPYPGPTAVEALSKAGEITTEQVKKWFANKRNRCKNTKQVPEIANMKRKRQFSARW